MTVAKANSEALVTNSRFHHSFSSLMKYPWMSPIQHTTLGKPFSLFTFKSDFQFLASIFSHPRTLNFPFILYPIRSKPSS
ncbi:unnamed protein product [Citrullus colocynthis]|uniref:Uncharacterized protein n=1 Tax=Citrullus colocynthis TaxID=252529 RepID=A0ABP0YWB1_9ROSI